MKYLVPDAKGANMPGAIKFKSCDLLSLGSWADIFKPDVLKDIGDEGRKHIFLRTTKTDLDL